MANNRTTNIEEFNPNEVVKKAHNLMENPDVFSQTFCGALNKQVDMRSGIQGIVLSSLKADVAFRDELKSVIRDVDKEDWRHFLKKIGLIGWTFIVFVGGIVATKLLDKFL